MLGQIDQTFGGQDLYATAEEKAANLLYMVVKDHPFGDGNKRTGAALFAFFLDRNKIDIGKAIPGNMLTALTLIAAASDSAKKDETIALIRSLLASSELRRRATVRARRRRLPRMVKVRCIAPKAALGAIYLTFGGFGVSQDAFLLRRDGGCPQRARAAHRAWVRYETPHETQVRPVHG